MVNTSIHYLQHVAIIMDGNGRWAKKRNLPRVAGHTAGIKTLRKLIEYAVQLKLNALTVFAFSTENWQRPKQEVSKLMELFMSALQTEVDDLHANNVCLRIVGDKQSFNSSLQNAIGEAEALTINNDGLQLNIAMNYSGRWDILQACRALVKEGQQDIDEAHIAARLCFYKYSDPDLFIRTGGEQRISNYLLWQLAYTELYFTNTLWPDFDSEQFNHALNWFSSRERRFGKTSEQIIELSGD